MKFLAVIFGTALYSASAINLRAQAGHDFLWGDSESSSVSSVSSESSVSSVSSSDVENSGTGSSWWNHKVWENQQVNSLPQENHQFLWWGDSESSSSYVQPNTQTQNQNWHKQEEESTSSSSSSSSSVAPPNVGEEPAQLAPRHDASKGKHDASKGKHDASKGKHDASKGKHLFSWDSQESGSEVDFNQEAPAQTAWFISVIISIYIWHNMKCISSFSFETLRKKQSLWDFYIQYIYYSFLVDININENILFFRKLLFFLWWSIPKLLRNHNYFYFPIWNSSFYDVLFWVYFVWNSPN